MKRFRSILEFESAINQKLLAGDLESSLKEIVHLVDLFCNEPLLVGFGIGSVRLDSLCSKIGFAIGAKGSFEPAAKSGASSKPRLLYLATRLQGSGGHGKLLLDFIRFGTEYDHVVVCSGLLGPSEDSFKAQLRAINSSVQIVEAPSSLSLVQRVQWITQQLLVSDFERIFLLNHHQDAVVVAAVSDAFLLAKSIFVHHGDHHFSLGARLNGVIHVDLHQMGFNGCKEHLNGNNLLLNMTSEDYGTRASDSAFLSEGRLVTCTAARSNKVGKSYYLQYVDLIPRLIQKTNGKHIHIGLLHPWLLYRLKKNLKKIGVPPERFVYIPQVVSLWRTLLAEKVDLYLASFPIGGGLTLIEAMGSGTPVVLHQHLSSPTLSCIDLGPSESFNWSQEAKLLDYCVELDAVQLTELSKASRAQYDRNHSGVLFQSSLNKILARPGNAIDFKSAQDGRDDEYALWVLNQNGLIAWVAKNAYRVARKLSTMRF
jgi:hypothetical protein